MRIGIISDIHDNILNLLKSFENLNKQKVSQVFFCGDLNSPFTIDYFTKFRASVMAVFGNNEGDKMSIIKRIEKNKLNFQYASDRQLMWNIKLSNQRVAVFHGHQPEITESVIYSNLYNYVITAHNHISHIKRVNETLWINPGCVCGYTSLDVKPVSPTLSTLDLRSKRAKIINI